MKKVAILSSVNIKHMSLISLYTDVLKKNGINYDIIYMDKYDEDEAFECAHKYRFVNVVKQNWPTILKEAKYMTFVPYAKRILTRENYDFIIVWNDVAIFQFGEFLARHFKDRYCLNVRDNMRYDDPRFAWRYKHCFAASAFNTISSRGYLDFLPKNAEYLPIHSLNLSVLEGMKIHTNVRTESKPIRIGFIGYVRFYERNKKLLNAFKNDSRFELHYYGKGAEILEEYAKENDINNTVFHGGFPVSETSKYLEQIDVINNLYGNETVNLQKAISIKFYHALYSRIPILVCPNTYIGALAKDLGYGFEIADDDIKDTLPDRFYEWYRGLDYEKLDDNARDYLKSVEKENQELETMIYKYLI